MTYLAREQSHPEVYVVDTNQKFWIPTPSALFAMGYTWVDVKVVADGSLAGIPTIQADSLVPTPPSLVFFPDTPKHFALDTPNAKHIVSRGSNVCLVELHGWLRVVDGGCNGSDPDWHYYLEVDPEWSDSVRIDLNQLLKVGNILAGGAIPDDPACSPYAMLSLPCVQVELNGWLDAQHPGLAKPEDWSFTTASACPDNPLTVWAFNPLHPNPSDPQVPSSSADHPVFDPVPGSNNPQAALYVKMTGSLVTDDPHTGWRGWYAFLARQYNIIVSLADENTAVRQLWDSRAATDPQNIARWTEMHPPDGIWVLGTKMPKYTLRGVAVFARNGLFVGDQQALDADIHPPGPRPAGMRAAVSEDVGSETNFSTIIEGNATKSGAQLTLYDDHVHVHVKVQGQGGWGAPGKFKALYRVYWEPIPPPPASLQLNVEPYPVPLNKPVQVIVHAKDSRSGAQVAGMVKIDGRIVGNTNSPFTYTFRVRNVGQPREPVYPQGTVSAAGYPDTDIDFGF